MGAEDSKSCNSQKKVEFEGFLQNGSEEDAHNMMTEEITDKCKKWMTQELAIHFLEKHYKNKTLNEAGLEVRELFGTELDGHDIIRGNDTKVMDAKSNVTLNKDFLDKLYIQILSFEMPAVENPNTIRVVHESVKNHWIGSYLLAQPKKDAQKLKVVVGVMEARENREFYDLMERSFEKESFERALDMSKVIIERLMTKENQDYMKKVFQKSVPTNEVRLAREWVGKARSTFMFLLKASETRALAYLKETALGMSKLFIQINTEMWREYVNHVKDSADVIANEISKYLSASADYQDQELETEVRDALKERKKVLQELREVLQRND